MESNKEEVKARTDAFIAICDDIIASLRESGYANLSFLEDIDLKLLVSNVALKTLMHPKCEAAKPSTGANWEYKPKKDSSA